MNKLILTFLIIITIVAYSYSFYTHEVNNQRVKEMSQISKEIQINSIIIEKNCIEIKNILEKVN